MKSYLMKRKEESMIGLENHLLKVVEVKVSTSTSMTSSKSLMNFPPFASKLEAQGIAIMQGHMASLMICFRILTMKKMTLAVHLMDFMSLLAAMIASSQTAISKLM